MTINSKGNLKIQLCQIHKTKQKRVKLPDGSIAWFCKHCNNEMNRLLGEFLH